MRSKPFEAYSYGIDRSSGALSLVGKGPLAESYPYITIDRSGRFLLSASYGANQVGVNPIGSDGRVGEPLQVIATARNAHAIRTDNTNRFVFVPHLGTDQLFQFLFDEKSGKLTANTPPVESGANQDPHGVPRRTEAAQDQKSDHLKAGGTITDHCAGGPCHSVP